MKVTAWDSPYPLTLRCPCGHVYDSDSNKVHHTCPFCKFTWNLVPEGHEFHTPLPTHLRRHNEAVLASRQ